MGKYPVARFNSANPHSTARSTASTETIRRTQRLPRQAKTMMAAAKPVITTQITAPTEAARSDHPWNLTVTRMITASRTPVSSAIVTQRNSVDLGGRPMANTRAASASSSRVIGTQPLVSDIGVALRSGQLLIIGGRRQMPGSRWRPALISSGR